MASTWVKVVWNRDTDVFVNGLFTEAAGVTNKPFRVEIGQNTFTVLTPAGEIEAEATKIVARATRRKPEIVDLQANGTPP